MKKQELEAIFGDGENTPISVRSKTTFMRPRTKLRDFAVGMCTLKIEEAAPKLRGVLLRAAEGEGIIGR